MKIKLLAAIFSLALIAFGCSQQAASTTGTSSEPSTADSTKPVQYTKKKIDPNVDIKAVNLVNKFYAWYLVTIGNNEKGPKYDMRVKTLDNGRLAVDSSLYFAVLRRSNFFDNSFFTREWAKYTHCDSVLRATEPDSLWELPYVQPDCPTFFGNAWIGSSDIVDSMLVTSAQNIDKQTIRHYCTGFGYGGNTSWKSIVVTKNTLNGWKILSIESGI